MHCPYCTALTALLLLHCPYCTAFTVLLLLHCSYCTALTALLLLHCSHCTALTALLSLRWPLRWSLGAYRFLISLLPCQVHRSCLLLRYLRGCLRRFFCVLVPTAVCLCLPLCACAYRCVLVSTSVCLCLPLCACAYLCVLVPASPASQLEAAAFIYRFPFPSYLPTSQMLTPAFGLSNNALIALRMHYSLVQLLYFPTPHSVSLVLVYMSKQRPT
jgi:hypothetical protein